MPKLITGQVITTIAFPTFAELNRILGEDRIDIVSPFYSRWALQRLMANRHSEVRFITRLPTSFASPPPFLDNDPRPLSEAMSRLGRALVVYALPNVHAKLYFTTNSGWLGSANFSRNGFSGVGELLLRFTPPSEDLRRAFNLFRSKAVIVSQTNVEKLAKNVRAGLTRVRRDLDVGQIPADVPVEAAASYADFETWLGKIRDREAANYIVDRIHNKNFMSGHAYSGFHGTLSFLLGNPKIAHELLKVRDLLIPEYILDRLAKFVRRFGPRFGGPRGGSWRSKLSVRLGGVHVGGGAGDVLVKRLLVQVPRVHEA